MRSLRFMIIAAVVLPVMLSGLAGCRDASINDPNGEFNWWTDLSSAEKHPDSFEPYLKKHPEDAGRRTAALFWYRRHAEGPDKLSHHTREMIKHHPSNMYIYFENVSSFYKDPEYMKEVIDLLEERVGTGPVEHGTYWNLANTCKQAAIPPVIRNPEAREKFLHYYDLPPDTELATEIDTGMADKSALYFQLAIKAPGEDDFHISFYSGQLAGLLTSLARFDEAAEVCEKALPHATQISKPGLLVTYGRALNSSGKALQAKSVFDQVRDCDTEGYQRGPGHATSDAETELGLIVLSEGDIGAAKRHLLSSCNVQQCCHSTTKGVRLDLARKLLDIGESDAVAEYCRQVLEKFTPDREDVETLLQRATELRIAANQKE